MSDNLTSIKNYLGKYYDELLHSAGNPKYKDTQLDLFFEQRFYIQNNKVQMVVEPSITGLVIIVSGNEIRISQDLYNHPNIKISNSVESNQATNPSSLYDADTFSTIAYLVCQNHTSFNITGEIDEPIYVKYSSDYETFFNSVLVFSIASEIDVEIVEEFESFCALNSVTNYIMYPNARVNLTTFYNNHLSAMSFCYRNIITHPHSKFNHLLLGRGSSNIIDETKIYATSNTESEMIGLVSSEGMNFHSILNVEAETSDYKINVNYKDVLEANAKVTFFPLISGAVPHDNNAVIDVSNIIAEEISLDILSAEINNYVADIIERTTLERMVGVKRFYDYKAKFIRLL